MDLPATTARAPEVTHRRLAYLAFPIMLANATEPLLGIVDTAVIGQIGEPALIGGVSIAAALFSMLFWAFGGLRISTAGLVAQAFGAGNDREIRVALARAFLIAALSGSALIILQKPIAAFALPLFGASEAAIAAASDYYDVRIWSAPFAFANYVVLGALIGLGRTWLGLYVQTGINVVNIALTFLFVSGLGWGVAGAALGTLMSAIFGAMGGLIVLHRLGLRLTGISSLTGISIGEMLERGAMARTLVTNGDFMIRSVALLFAFAFFTAQSARQGDVMLAANSLLFHIFSVGAFLLDGFAAASETFCGQALGARDRRAFHRAVTFSLIWANASALVLMVLAWPLAPPFLVLLTTSVEVHVAAMPFIPFAIATFVFGATAFVFDGVYGGATWSGPARNVMVLALAGYLAVFYATLSFGNAGLWWALLAFLAIRSLGLWLLYPRLRIAAFGS